METLDTDDTIDAENKLFQLEDSVTFTSIKDEYAKSINKEDIIDTILDTRILMGATLATLAVISYEYFTGII